MPNQDISGLPALLSPKQAAELLGVTVHTLSRWRKSRRHLPFIHVGGHVRYHLDTIRHFMQVGTSTPRPGGLDGRSIPREDQR